MASRTMIALAVALSVFGYLMYRVHDLENRVDKLSKQLAADWEQASSDSPKGNTASAREQSAAPARPDQRLAQLEKQVTALKAQLGASGAKGALEEASARPSESAILSVVERENERIRDVQLEWHRTRWLAGREQQLATFASHANLHPAQKEALSQVLRHEIDGLVGVLKKSELADDPDQAVSDWQAVLRDTDDRAQRVLSPEQLQAWTQARQFERKLFWPWLPDTPTSP